MRISLTFVCLFAFQILFGQNLTVKQDDDDILFFNESNQTIELWFRMQQKAINQIILPGKMKKFDNPKFLTREDLENSEIFYAYSYRALEQDVAQSLTKFYADLEKKRKHTRHGYDKIDQPFYSIETFKKFTRSKNINTTNDEIFKDFGEFVSTHLIPESRELLSNVHGNSNKYRHDVKTKMIQFLNTKVDNSSENAMFLNQLNQLESFFLQYKDIANERHTFGSLKDLGFETFKNNPSTDFGVYMTTNDFDVVKHIDLPKMDTRGFNFEVYAAQRFAKSRVGKRRTFNYYGAASYLSYKDKLYGLKKSFVNIGPEVRFTGYYNNQFQLIGSAGISMDITSDKYMVDDDSKKFGYYFGGDLGLLFIRFGMRYYSNIAEKEFLPEGHWFYRAGLVAKF